MTSCLRLAALILILPLLAGCASQNVHYFDRLVPRDRPNTTRIYVDAFGSLYPVNGLPAVITPDDQDLGWLHKMASRQASGFCSAAIEGTETKRLCDASGPLSNWRDAQAELWVTRAQTVLSAMHGENDTKTLVLLIHGFNNSSDDAIQSYEIAQHFIRKSASPSENLHFVELYWDGFTSSTGVGAWGKAQASGPVVGFNLRQFLNAITAVSNEQQTEMPRIRIVTHSSGAFVVGGLVGNPTAALPLLQREQPDWSAYDFFRQEVEASEGPYAVPQIDDLRIGMLAAATSSDTFTGTSDYPGGVLIEGATFYLSVMPKDEILTKLFLGADFPLSGATGLGAKYGYFCNQIRQSEDLTKRNVTFYGYDFLRDQGFWGNRHDAHDFSAYLEQATEKSSFFADFMSETGKQATNSGTRINCK